MNLRKVIFTKLRCRSTAVTIINTKEGRIRFFATEVVEKIVMVLRETNERIRGQSIPH